MQSINHLPLPLGNTIAMKFCMWSAEMSAERSPSKELPRALHCLNQLALFPLCILVRSFSQVNDKQTPSYPHDVKENIFFIAPWSISDAHLPIVCSFGGVQGSAWALWNKLECPGFWHLSIISSVVLHYLFCVHPWALGAHDPLTSLLVLLVCSNKNEVHYLHSLIFRCAFL